MPGAAKASDDVAARREARSRRGGVAIVVSLLILLQSLASIAPSFAHGYRTGETGLIASLFGEICAKNTQSTDESPRPHGHHAQCCILCSSAAGFDAPPHEQSEICDAAYFPAPDSLVLWRLADSGGRPVGWASTWSSRAPPLFS